MALFSLLLFASLLLVYSAKSKQLAVVKVKAK